MNTAARIKAHLPTVSGYLEKRKRNKLNQLPKHLRPLEIWPLWIQVTLNVGLIIALWNLVVDRDDFLTEAGPAIALVVCFLVLIYTVTSALHLRAQYEKTRGQRLSKINMGLVTIAFLSWAASIVVFLP